MLYLIHLTYLNFVVLDCCCQFMKINLIFWYCVVTLAYRNILSFVIY